MDPDNIPDDDFYEDIPSADPAIRTDYEAALGRFILLYNEVDYRLSQVIRCELSQRGCADLTPILSKGKFLERVATLEVLSKAARNTLLSASHVQRLQSINADRNNLAHGHLDQNPFDGSYDLVLAKKRADYPTERIRSLADELAQIAKHLRVAEILYDFKDLTADDASSATPSTRSV